MSTKSVPKTVIEKGADPKTAPKFVCLQTGACEVFDENRRPIVIQPWSERTRHTGNSNLVFILQGEHYRQFTGFNRSLSPFPVEAAPVAVVATQSPTPPASTGKLEEDGAGKDSEPVPGLPSGDDTGDTLGADENQNGEDIGGSDNEGPEDFDEDEDAQVPVNDEHVPGIPGGTVKPKPAKVKPGKLKR